jgi:hypothetical protein
VHHAATNNPNLALAAAQAALTMSEAALSAALAANAAI